MHHPDQSSIEDQPFDAPAFSQSGGMGARAGSEAGAAPGLSKRAAKRQRAETKAAEGEDGEDKMGRNGKRAAGRAEIQRRLEEARALKEKEGSAPVADAVMEESPAPAQA